MNIFTRLGDLFTGKAAPTNNSIDMATWTPLAGFTPSTSARNLLEANKEWVYIAVNRIATSAASVRIKVMKYTRADDDQEVFTGPLVQFLENPGPGFTGSDFVYLNTVYKELGGNAFWERITSKTVYPVVPTTVSAQMSGSNLVGYRIVDTANQRVLGLDKVLHDRYIDPARPYWGVGKLQKITGWVDTSTYANEILKSFFLNGAVFGGFIKTEEETEARIKLIKLGLNNDHVGVKNAHKLAVLPKGAEYQASMAKMSDMEMGTTDDRFRDKILAGFGVPKTLVGLTTEVNRATAEASEYVFARYTLKPIMDDLMQFLNTNVATILDPSGQYYFEYEDFIPQNQQDQIAERTVALAGQAYKSANEVRAEIGLPPIQGGDVVYGKAGQVPLGEPQPTTAPAATVPANDPTNPPAKSRKMALPSRIRSFERKQTNLENLVDDIVAKVKAIPSEHPDQRAHGIFAGRVDRFAEQLDSVIKTFNSQQENQVVKNLNAATKAVDKRSLFDLTGETSLMVDAVSPILAGLLTEQAIAEYVDQGFAGELDTSDMQITKVVTLAAQRLSKSYNATTIDLLTKELEKGLKEGDSLSQLVKRVQDVYAYSSAVRAKMVAHTESFYIANKANQEVYRQSGVVKTQRWYTADSEACPFCAPMNGKVISVEDIFINKGQTIFGTDENGKEVSTVMNYRAIDVPPLHPDCRCFIRPEEITISE